ncbi:MAG TPA: 3-deoxy-7-phosphoheptulonate synthase [bacterium]|nr:3-deoxy-7-phosphoheptulonate synthase [bacterium]HEX67755.1 3-deoxy-7-phosphoheptulonate synthase [bacterium]
MIIVLKPEATQENIEKIKKDIEKLGLKVWVSQGEFRTIMGVIGDESPLRDMPLSLYPGVEKVIPILKPYRLVDREYKKENTVIELPSGVKIGGKEIVVMAGPCAVESKENVLRIAKAVKKEGAKVLRGGAFKPRTSPYSFQGLGEEGLKILKEVSEETGLSIVTEVMDPRNVELVYQYADILQIGARNMHNYDLLKEVGKIDKPVLLKRGISSTVKEWLLAAEYILKQGNEKVIFCERGIRTFEDSTRFTLDVNAVPLLKKISHLPVIVDPSHSTGRRDLVIPVARAGIAAGADGLLVEVHFDPLQALSDAQQTIDIQEFEILMEDIRRIAQVMGREV